jgi:hypothetical protein
MQMFREQPGLESITYPFIRAGVAWTGPHHRRRPSFQPGLAFPSPRPPDMQQPREVVITISFIHATKRECPLNQGPSSSPTAGVNKRRPVWARTRPRGILPRKSARVRAKCSQISVCRIRFKSCTMD